MQLRIRIFKLVVMFVLLSPSVARLIAVSVSGGGFGPPDFTANTGDQIKISFTVGTATFTQSTLDQPCVPLSSGIDSGQITIPPGAGPKSFTFTISSEQPLFFFNFLDGSTDKCKSGFVATINASSQQRSQFRNNINNVGNVQTVGSGLSDIVKVPPAAQQPAVTTDPHPGVINVETNLPSVTTTQNILITASPSANPPPVTLLVDTSPTSSPASFQSSTLESVSPFFSSTQSGHTLVTPVQVAVTASFEGTTTVLGSISSPAGASPTQGSQPVPSPRQTSGPEGPQVVAIVIGVMLGVILLVACVLVLATVRRRRASLALLPRVRSSPPGAHSGDRASWRSGMTHMFTSVRARITSTLPWPRLRWKRLEEGERRRITPFLADPSPVVNSDKAGNLPTASVETRQIRHLSDETLVPESRTPSHRSDTSLLVNGSISEKEVTDTYLLPQSK